MYRYVCTNIYQHSLGMTVGTVACFSLYPKQYMIPRNVIQFTPYTHVWLQYDSKKSLLCCVILKIILLAYEITIGRGG